MESDFFSDVYEVVKLIPKGRVTSYGAIGEYLGLKSSARMVGWAMNKTPGGQGIPAHRVVNRNGVLTGRHCFPAADTMQKLLEAEGVEVENDKITNFKAVFWHPVTELGL